MTTTVTADKIRELQIILDSSDPFLIEALYDKTTNELEQTLARLYKEKEIIPKENAQWMQRQNDIIKTVSAMIEMRKAYDVEDDSGGVSIT